MKQQKYYIYWIKGTFRWKLIATYIPLFQLIKDNTHTHFIEAELYIAPSVFNHLTKEQSFSNIKNGDFVIATHTPVAVPEDITEIIKPNVKEYIFIINMMKHIT